MKFLYALSFCLPRLYFADLLQQRSVEEASAPLHLLTLC